MRVHFRPVQSIALCWLLRHAQIGPCTQAQHAAGRHNLQEEFLQNLSRGCIWLPVPGMPTADTKMQHAACPCSTAGRLTVPSHIVGGRGNLLDQAGPQVLQAVVELDRFCHCDTILRDLGRPVGLLNDYIAALHRAWVTTHRSCWHSSTAPWRLAGPYIARET